MAEFFQKQFNSYSEYQTEFEEYKQATFQVLVVRSSQLLTEFDPSKKVFKYAHIKYTCKHSTHHRCRPTDQTRPNQQTYFTDCPFKAHLRFNRKKNCLEFGNIYEISKIIYQKLS